MGHCPGAWRDAGIDYGLGEFRRYAPDLNHDLDTAVAR
jgi:hypothetical protein